MYLRLKLDGVVDYDQLEADVERERVLNGFLPLGLTRIEGDIVRVLVDSPLMPEPDARRVMNIAIGRQGRRLSEV